MRLTKLKKFIFSKLFDTPTMAARVRRSSTKQQRRSRKKKKPVKPQKKSYPVRRFAGQIPVQDSHYVMEYTLLDDRIYEISKNRFDFNKNPIIDVAPNKTQDLRDEFSSYCGQKKTIKNWLFYV